ncbi:MAG TPA: hypothetical protein VM578_12370 [Candidatus Saccharimonadales bacterium]|nr:hypothetical protein [Candidatus Saccharimonadales bacterium]
MSEPNAKSDGKPKKPDWDEVFEALDKAPLPEDFLSDADRDRSLPQECNLFGDDRDPADYDDEPRSNGNLGLDPQQKEAAEKVMKQYRNTLKKLAE